MTKNSTATHFGRSALRWPKSKGLVILMAFGAGLAVFGIISVLFSLVRYVKLSSQDDMLKAAPDTFVEGSMSNVFSGPGYHVADDVTAYHPAYLMGAISAVLPQGDGCKLSEQVNFKFFAAYCGLPRGSIAVVSNMMPQLMIAVANNKFDAHGIPLGENGTALQRPEPPYYMGATSYATIRYSEATPDQPRVSDLIVGGLTGGHLADISRSGGWLPARHGLGFRTCYASKDSTGIDVTCYRG